MTLSKCGPIPALGAAVLLAFLASVAIGPAGWGLPAEGVARTLILTEIRLPRAVLGLLIGGALGLSGAVLQGYLRNPLAEPGLIGVSGGASLGAVIAIHTGAAATFALALPLGGLIGAAITTFAVLVLAGDRSGPLTLILAGIAISTLTTALTTLALNLAPNPFASVEILFWLLGSLADRSLVHVWLAAPLIVVGAGLLLATRNGLDALSLGDAVAANLGIELKRLRSLIIAGTALAVGAATAVAGTISFVGLIVPHLLRPFVGAEPGKLLWPSALGGGTMVLAADVGVRLLAPAGDLRLGVVTALIGAPFFVWLVLKTRSEFAA